MANKIIRIEYDPYNNRIKFSESLNAGNTWQNMSENSALKTYENQEFVFSNCVKDIVEIINRRHNTSEEGIDINFVGTESDFYILERTIEDENKKIEDKGPIVPYHSGCYKTADEAIEIIRDSYDRISEEFEDYLPGSTAYSLNDTTRDIGDSIRRFQDVVSKEIPVCVLGTYSVGKSALVNAIIGDEILPSNINPCTAKDVKIETDKEYQIEFSYKDNLIKLIINENGIAPFESSEYAEEIIHELETHCNLTGKDEATIIHDILAAFNEGEESFPSSSYIGWNISVKCPFNKSLLDQEDCKIVIYDTPGSNNKEIDQEKHRIALEELMSKQTNALPVFVVDRNNIVGNDSEEVKDLLDRNRNGFSNPNCLIVVSKADNLTKQNLVEPIPAQVQNWHGNTTILYVCPVGAIGEKKGDKEWIDTDYKEIYDEWKKTEKDQVYLPEYNRIPCEYKRDRKTKDMVSPALYATGIPSLENEINDYVERYANYKKCINGRDTLINAMNLAKELHNKKQEELIKTKEEKRKEQAKLRSDLEKRIDDIKIPSVFISNIERKYISDLDKYCKKVLPKIQSIWPYAKQEKDTKGFINRVMQGHCLSFFKETYEKENGIRDEIKKTITKNYSDYMETVRTVVNDNRGKLSAETNQELDKLFDEDKALSLKAVELKGEGKIIWLFRKLPILGKRLEEKYMENMADSICDQLRRGGNRGKGHTEGLFRELCIHNPAVEYMKQASSKKDVFIKEVRSTLQKENAILSQKDEEIAAIEEEIAILQERLDNLNSVDETLHNVLSHVEND